MADVHSGIIRSKNMRAIASDNTVIEQKVAGLLDQMAVGYRVQAAELPGKPDFVLDAYNAVIFVHGCFWHQHNCHFFKLPATRTDFWRDKINKNSERNFFFLFIDQWIRHNVCKRVAKITHTIRNTLGARRSVGLAPSVRCGTRRLQIHRRGDRAWKP